MERGRRARDRRIDAKASPFLTITDNQSEDDQTENGGEAQQYGAHTTRGRRRRNEARETTIWKAKKKTKTNRKTGIMMADVHVFPRFNATQMPSARQVATNKRNEKIAGNDTRHVSKETKKQG